MDYRNIGIMMYGLAISVNIVFVTSFSFADGIVIAYDHYNGTEEFEDVESTFGSSIPDNGMLGVLVRAEPHDGCQPLKPPPFPSGFNQRNVTLASFALIVRGNCEFGAKILNAQNSGYLAAVVYNDESDLLIKMSSTISGITIPSVFVGITAGAILNSSYLYDRQGQPYIQLYEGSINPLEYYLIPFVIVLAVCFVSLLCFMIIKCCRDRRRQRRGRLSLERLKKLPVKNFEKGDEYDICAICLDDYEEGDKLRILPCAHAYHCKCVDPWLTSSKRICPLCKRRVLSDDEDSSSSEEDDSDDERTPLVQASTASSPNSSLFATGFSRNNPIIRAIARQNRRASTSSTETVSTSTSSDEEQQMSSIRTSTSTSRSTRREDLPQTSDGYQSQRLSATPILVDTVRVYPSPVDDSEEDVQVLVMGGNRVSESSITVISECDSPSSSISRTPEEHSYNSMDFHSLDDNSLAAQDNTLSEPYSDGNESDVQDDIIVIAGGSRQAEQRSTPDA